jgi:hypothetical protein
MPMVAERRANSVLALIDARKALQEPSPNMDILRRQYDAAVAEYGAAHAPTADEIKAILLEHLDTDVKVYFSGGQVSVCVGLMWSDNSKNHNQRFGHDQDDDNDNQCLGECC